MNNSQFEMNIPGINAQSGLYFCDGDFDIYLKSLNLFVANMPLNLEKMKTVTKENLKDYIISVHGIKSNSEYIGAHEVKETAEKLEKMGREGDIAGIMAENEAFLLFTNKLLNDLRNWLNKNGA